MQYAGILNIAVGHGTRRPWSTNDTLSEALPMTLRFDRAAPVVQPHESLAPDLPEGPGYEPNPPHLRLDSEGVSGILGPLLFPTPRRRSSFFGQAEPVRLLPSFGVLLLDMPSSDIDWNTDDRPV